MAAADVATGTGDGGTADDEWPPEHFADNDHILTWWLPDYDIALQRLAQRWGWAWIRELHELLRSLIPESVLNAWITSDPLCSTYAWYNVLENFAVARAKQLGFAPRQPVVKTCEACSQEFHEMEVPLEYVERLGLDNVTFCRDCLTWALSPHGSDDATPEEVVAVMAALAKLLGRTPTDAELRGKVDLDALSADERRKVIRALAVKPSLTRVQELFGSVSAAVARAGVTDGFELPPLDHRRPSRYPRREQTVVEGAEWPTYQELMGPLPALKGRVTEVDWSYHVDVRALMATGALALAEAALRELCQQDATYHLDLARLYAETARRDDAVAALDQYNRLVRADVSDWFSADTLPAPRDIRTVADTPIFYTPLHSPPRGNVRFVLIGGAMDYVDRRGEHACISGEGGAVESELADNVSRVNAMAEDSFWITSAVGIVHSLLNGLRRTQTGPQNAHVVAYSGDVSGTVKATTGAAPKRIAEDDWRIGLGGKTGWSRERSPGRYVFNAHDDFSLVEVQTRPAAVIWAWPDRSDLCLQALLDTIAVDAHSPVTVVLPDVPHFRRFARTYVRRGVLENIARSLLEDAMYTDMVPNQRGVVLSAEFAPQLVIQPDARELKGGSLASALAYLDARHNLRLSVWDVLDDPLLCESATRTPVATTRQALSEFRRNEMVMWYERYRQDSEVPDELFRRYRPRILDWV